MDLDYEKKYLDDLLLMLKMYNYPLYQTMHRTGTIASKIGHVLGVSNPEYYFAGFYANIGLLSSLRIVNKPSVLSDDEYSTIKRHPHLGAKVLVNKGMNYAAKLVEHHHELPSGNGYYKINTYPHEAMYLNIADVFQGAITHKDYRPSLTFDEAIKSTFVNYENNLSMDKNILNEIKQILGEYYVIL